MTKIMTEIMTKNDSSQIEETSDPVETTRPRDETTAERPKEIGGPKGPEPTRYGDWEKAGRCIDF